MTNCIHYLKAAAFVECTAGLGPIVTGAAVSLLAQAIEPLVLGSAISVVANLIGLIGARIFIGLGVAKSGEFAPFGAMISTIANIGLIVAGIVAGIVPGGLLGVAMIVTSVAVSLLATYTSDACLTDCLKI